MRVEGAGFGIKSIGLRVQDLLRVQALGFGTLRFRVLPGLKTLLAIPLDGLLEVTPLIRRVKTSVVLHTCDVQVLKPKQMLFGDCIQCINHHLMLGRVSLL